MIDLDLLESAVKKPQYARTDEDNAALSPVVYGIGLLELISRLRQAEKDAARYRWMRKTSNTGQTSVGFMISVDTGVPCAAFSSIDEAIDEAMNASNN